MPLFQGALAPTETHATPSTLKSMGMKTSKQRQAEGITLVMVGATTVPRTEA
jgi:hypothetical protein